MTNELSKANLVPILLKLDNLIPLDIRYPGKCWFFKNKTSRDYPIFVVKYLDKYYIVDGNHRYFNHLLRGKTHIKCYLVDENTIIDECNSDLLSNVKLGGSYFTICSNLIDYIGCKDCTYECKSSHCCNKFKSNINIEELIKKKMEYKNSIYSDETIETFKTMIKEAGQYE